MNADRQRGRQASGAWILADEVYRGAEREREEETPSFFGRYDKVLCTWQHEQGLCLSGSSRGLDCRDRQHTVDDIWRRHEYTTITASMLSNILATHALSPDSGGHD